MKANAVRDSISKAVLITGCSSGIGRATAERLASRGWNVYATARSRASIEDLAERGCELLELDVTDDSSMRAAVDAVEEADGAVGVLVNNAGFGQEGAVESLSLEQMRAQFETNFFGLARMIQLVLPKMRGQAWGKIVNVSSMGGRMVLPGGGAYHASKFAVEALSDALRFEVAPFGVDVIVVEPGLIRTDFGRVAIDTVGDAAASDGAYDDFNVAVARRIHDGYYGESSRFAAPPEVVAKTIEKAVTARRPRARYPVTAIARVMIGARRWLPDRVFDALLATQFPRPRVRGR